MIKIYGGYSDTIVKKANEKLNGFFEIYHDLIFSNNVNDDTVDGLSILFPDSMIKQRKDKCMEAIDELYY